MFTPHYLQTGTWILVVTEPSLCARFSLPIVQYTRNTTLVVIFVDLSSDTSKYI